MHAETRPGIHFNNHDLRRSQRTGNILRNYIDTADVETNNAGYPFGHCPNLRMHVIGNIDRRTSRTQVSGLFQIEYLPRLQN